MFSFTIVAIVVPVTISCCILSMLFLARQVPQLAQNLMRFGLAGASYIILAGVFMLTGWDDPLKSDNAVSAEQHAAMGDAMTSALMLDAWIWGLVLIVGGGYLVYLFTELMTYAKHKNQQEKK